VTGSVNEKEEGEILNKMLPMIVKTAQTDRD
jgi:hypothetical protein